jgi:hypothetical protein
MEPPTESLCWGHVQEFRRRTAELPSYLPPRGSIQEFRDNAMELPS